MSADEPRLPPELEQEVFATAALLDQDSIPTLLLVAHRVRVWIEPYLYRSLDLSILTARQALLDLSSAKPPSFLASAVRHVIFKIEEDSERHKRALRLCTGITHLAVSAASDNTNYGLLAVLNLMHIERFAGSIVDLFGQPPEHPMDGRHPAFRFLTHLEIFDNLGSDAVDAFVIALPSLTHLATESTEGAQRILEGCQNLRILVSLRRTPQVDDPRIVVCDYLDWAEAAAPAPQQTFWDVAEEFLERKRRGEVQGYWAY
ncbi:hypothetical protein C8F01DRAFT_1369212 [Mycena amicta]|nr:hypothetical protein C8F01DRAFT_1369212 [Mycena amicta]